MKKPETEKEFKERQKHAEPIVDEIMETMTKPKKNTVLVNAIMPRFVKTKYTLDELEQYLVELSHRTDKHIHRGKLTDIAKIIRWRMIYDALNIVFPQNEQIVEK